MLVSRLLTFVTFVQGLCGRYMDLGLMKQQSRPLRAGYNSESDSYRNRYKDKDKTGIRFGSRILFGIGSFSRRCDAYFGYDS